MKRALETFIFSQRYLILALFSIVSIFMLYFASQLKVDAGFSKFLPLQHPYMQTYVEYKDEFGGANRILIAVVKKQGDIFEKETFAALKNITDEVFFIPGVDRASVKSIFTPNVRFTEVVEDGIAGGNIIPNDFETNEDGFAKVRNNILKSNYLGRLVSNDFTGVIVSAELQEINPVTNEKIDFVEVGHKLEDIRQQYSSKEFDIHIIGFAKAITDISDGASKVISFFIITFFITLFLVWLFTQSLQLSLVPLLCSLVAVIWQLGLLSLLGFGIDPMTIIVPFLIFAIGVSHGVQMVAANRAEIFLGKDTLNAAKESFNKLLIPGIIALLSDTIGFVTIYLIDIQVIQELAITASLGVAVIIITNLILIPIILSFLSYDIESYRDRIVKRAGLTKNMWLILSSVALRPKANLILIVSLVILVLAYWQGKDIKIGDLHKGVPELHPDSQYNIDTDVITNRFSIGVDILTVIVETKKEGCIDYGVMRNIDNFEWHMRNVEGVQSVIALPGIAKKINAGWNEGYPKWNVLPSNQQTLVQSVAYVDTSTGLLNEDCSVMPVLIFTQDHKAKTIDTIIQAVNAYSSNYPYADIQYKLATGNVGVMAASNEAVSNAQFKILFYVFAAIIFLCLVSFRSFSAMLCVVIPLAIVSVSAYALMSLLEIGLKVSTLPVVALGVGIGVDYGIYIFSRLQSVMKRQANLRRAYAETLMITGNAVLFTGITLAIGVFTWIFSPLKFQADMGLLLTFMFLVNMLATIFILPALASYLLPNQQKDSE